MRVLVTGGAGFIGQHSVRAILAAGHHVTVYDNLSTGHREVLPLDAITFVKGDIRDGDLLRATVCQISPHAILHLAALVSVPQSVQEPEYAHSVNLTGTLNVL